MILLIGAFSGIGLVLIKELVKYDAVKVTYNKKKIDIKIKNRKRLFTKPLDIGSEKNIKKFIENYSKILKRVTFINLASISVDKLINQIPSKKIGKIKNISNIIQAIIKFDYINTAEIKTDGGL
tara:strand:- start:87 stop:458 length:372 start_codon:yes stop_codon:yes gene_type:complete